jgi:hypothetical protein
MLAWIVEKIIAIVSYVPAQLLPPDSQHFTLIRSMFALLVIVLILLVVALHPLRSIRRYISDRQATDHGVER